MASFAKKVLSLFRHSTKAGAAEQQLVDDVFVLMTAYMGQQVMPTRRGAFDAALKKARTSALQDRNLFLRVYRMKIAMDYLRDDGLSRDQLNVVIAKAYGMVFELEKQLGL